MFAKIFSQIYDSSIVENAELRFTFMDMLVLADCNGVVDMTHEAISRRTNRPIDLIRQTITELESPDTKSRSPEFSGARIKRLDDHRDWGWMIVNYDRFRQIASEEQRRVKTLARVHKYRGVKPVHQRNALKRPVTQSNAGNAKQKQRQTTEAEEYKGGAVELAWNELSAPFKKLRLPLSTGRRTTVRTRLAEPQWENCWREALSVLPQLDFMRGVNDRGWIADFDFFIRPDSVAKILEGKYNNGTHQKPITKGSSRTYGTANERTLGQYDQVGKVL